MLIRWHTVLCLVVLGIPLTARTSFAAEENWPCVQRRVPELSAAQMWGGPPVDLATSRWRDDPDVAPLVRALAPRRMNMDEATTAIERFARSTGSDKETKLVLLFAGVFELINTERRRLIAGIERYAGKQRVLADEITEMNRVLRANEKPEAERTALEQRLKWETRVYDDRNQALTYVCESPVLLEQRAFALAREIARQHE